VSHLLTPNAGSIVEFLEDLTRIEMGLSIRTLGTEQSIIFLLHVMVFTPWEEQSLKQERKCGPAKPGS
jgi:hypothetical protein